MLSYRIIAEGYWSRYGVRLKVSDPAYRLFREVSDWSAFWSKEFGRPVPAVDFEGFFVIYITQGQKMTGGYSLNIGSVVDQSNHLGVRKVQIVLDIQEPAPGQGVDLGETNPFIIAQIEWPGLISKEREAKQWQLEFLERINGQLSPIHINEIAD